MTKQGTKKERERKERSEEVKEGMERLLNGGKISDGRDMETKGKKGGEGEGDEGEMDWLRGERRKKWKGNLMGDMARYKGNRR